MILFASRSVVCVGLFVVSCLYGCPFERRAIVIEAPDVADTEVVSTPDLGVPEDLAQDRTTPVDQATSDDMSMPNDVIDGTMACEAPSVRCGDRCVNTTNDNSHCGGCAHMHAF
jgi:hypothetical protein